MIRPLITAAAMAAVLVPTGAWADFDDLRDDLERQMDQLARDIDDLGDDGRDEDDVASVRKDLRDVEQIVDAFTELEGPEVPEDDVEELVDGYAEDLEELETALIALEEMKSLSGQIAPTSVICEDMDREMSRTLQIVIADPKESISLKDAGEAIGKDAEALIETADEILDDMLSASQLASNPDFGLKDFDKIERALEDAARQTYRTEEGDAEDLRDACEPLVKYQSHPAYKTARKMVDDRDGAIDAFIENAEDWLAGNEKIGDQICHSLAQMRDAYCSVDTEPNEKRSVLSDYDRLANLAADKFLDQIAAATRAYDRELAYVGSNLAPFDSLVAELNASMGRRMAYFRRLESSQVLRGSNHPKNRLWREYGVQQHNLLQQSPDCHVIETAIPGFNGSMRVDCIDISACKVVEFKPDTPSGSDSGARVNDYERALNAWLESEYRSLAMTPVPTKRARRGMKFDDEFVMQSIAYGCLADGDARYKGIVEAYDPCSKDRDLICEP